MRQGFQFGVQESARLKNICMGVWGRIKVRDLRNFYGIFLHIDSVACLEVWKEIQDTYASIFRLLNFSPRMHFQILRDLYFML